MNGLACDPPCGLGQACVHACGPSCWPIGPNCASFCVDPTGQGCFSPRRCTKPEPFCVDLPLACLRSLHCSCVPASICAAYGGCFEVEPRFGVTCAG
jgi:hypothetical protein